MTQQVSFKYPLKGPGRPQILLIGNGLEYKSGQQSWQALVQSLTLPENRDSDAQSLPFPLRYEVLATSPDASYPLTQEEISKEERRLAEAMKTLVNQSNEFIDILPELKMDHIFTTNYSYCLEKAFFPKADFTKDHTRTKYRFFTSSEYKNEKPHRLHSGYLYTDPQTLKQTGLWHIHGEAQSAKGIVLGHDLYGRLQARIVQCCSKVGEKAGRLKKPAASFTSWPELFLFADLYILGFGFDECEFDLWWLLRRKQRERYADGKVYYYDLPPADEKKKARHLLLRANGVNVEYLGADENTDYDNFYRTALADIQKRVNYFRQQA